MDDRQVQNIIDFENALATIHSKRAKQMKQFLVARKKKRAEIRSKKTTIDILGKFSEQTSKQQED